MHLLKDRIYIVDNTDNSIYEVVGRNTGYITSNGYTTVGVLSLNVNRVIPPPKGPSLTCIHISDVKTGGRFRSISEVERLMYAEK